MYTQHIDGVLTLEAWLLSVKVEYRVLKRTWYHVCLFCVLVAKITSDVQ